MKWVFLVEVLVVNAFLIPLLVLISVNYGLRTAYWGPEGFTPATVRYPLFLITSAVKGSTSIPGLLTVDWQQIVALILVLTDAIYLWTVLRSRKVTLPHEALPASE